MAIELEDRLILVEKDLNRIMELLFSAASVDDAEDYLKGYESQFKGLIRQCIRLEEAVLALKSKHNIASREIISE